MADENLRQLVVQGLTAMRDGGRIAEQATQEIRDDASSPDLRQALEEGSRTSRHWQERIERALGQIGDQGGEAQGNPVLEAHYEVSRRIRRNAPDEQSRDLGIIANGQMALHYWIAAFGTMRNYLDKLGMSEFAQDFRQSDEEAKQADQRHNELAEELLREPAPA